ncbi:MAG: carbonic anhydrase [Acidimicrobiales bacterium]|jgi:carbonic anhydrase
MAADEPPDLLAANKEWAASIVEDDPEFFVRLSGQQSPSYLWIGCADSRVPANQIVGLPPGEVFVHRNIANLVVPSDLNCLSVLQYAIDVLRVKHVVVTGHYGCGGINAVINNLRVGLADNWLRHLASVEHDHAHELEGLVGEEKANRFCEINVRSQVLNVARTTVVQDAWSRGHRVDVHGWVYGLADGLLRDLEVTVASAEDLDHLSRRYEP